jgi:hypothetical protein
MRSNILSDYVAQLRGALDPLAASTGRTAGFRSPGDPWADTTTAHRRLMLTGPGGLVAFGRGLIRARAVARGVRLGRKPKLTPHQQKEALRRRERGEATLAGIGRSYNVSDWTILRLAA